MGGSLVRGQALAGGPWASRPGSHVPCAQATECTVFAGGLMAGVRLAPGDMGRLPGTFISLSRLSCDRQAPALA